MGFQPNNPLPDEDKIALVIDGMKSGYTRQELAGKLGYQSYKSLHNYMTRKGCQWDGLEYHYSTPKQRALAGETVVPDLIKRILFLFDQPLANPDDIARQARIGGGRQELAQFMRARGYQWDPARNNYVHERDFGQKPVSPANNRTDSGTSSASNGNGSRSGFSDSDVRTLLPLLERLQENSNLQADRSYDSSTSPPRQLPRYLLHGIMTRKTIQMCSSLGDLVRTYSDECKISQRAVIEIALVEFFHKYGYANEINSIIK